MPRTSVDYSNTVIYKIVCKDVAITDLYVGSTTDFTKRKSQHKRSCNNPTDNDYNQTKYQCIRSNGGWENWDMLEIEKSPCSDGNEARTRERYWYEQLNANLSCFKPIRTVDIQQRF